MMLYYELTFEAPEKLSVFETLSGEQELRIQLTSKLNLGRSGFNNSLYAEYSIGEMRSFVVSFKLKYRD